jgi:hypothetical protein
MRPEHKWLQYKVGEIPLKGYKDKSNKVEISNENLVEKVTAEDWDM